MSFPSTSQNPTNALADRSWRLRHSAWLLAPIFGCGLLSFVGFVYVALRVRTKKFWIAAVVSCVASVPLWIASSTGEQAGTGDTGATPPAETAGLSDWAGGLILAIWGGLLVYGFLLNRDYLRWRASQDGSQAWYNQAATNAIPSMGSSSTGVPSSGQMQQPNSGYLGVSQGDYYATPGRQAGPNPQGASAPPPHPTHQQWTQYSPQSVAAPRSAEPVDVNAVSASTLATSLGIDPSLAARVVTVRDSRSGFSNLDDLVTATGLQPHELLRFQGKVTFGEVSGRGVSHEGSQPQQPTEGQTGGRIVDI